MEWKKLGQIFAPQNTSELMCEYARIPILDIESRNKIVTGFILDQETALIEKEFLQLN